MGELINDLQEFFAPASTDMIDGLVARYRSQREKIEAFHAEFHAKSLSGIIGYFFRRQEDSAPNFDLEIAVCALNADFWAEALAKTDVYNLMPQKRRDAWNAQMRAWSEPRYRKGKNPELDLPDFTDEAVRSTIGSLLAMRSQFFAERVDGIFKSLSRQHVTNCPHAFSKRMIIGGILSYGTPEFSRCGQINDLRCVIAKFMGRDEPFFEASKEVVKAAMRNPGEWMNVDGGALRIRVYAGVGTAHLEVHPEMAWRLNAVLASIYPSAIPAEMRRKPVKEKKIKDFALFDRPLPFKVISILSGMEKAKKPNPDKSYRANTYEIIKNAIALGSAYKIDRGLLKEVDAILQSIGAVKLKGALGDYYQFDYDYRPVLDEIICSGCIPDKWSHQFYPTPEKLSGIAVGMAMEGHEPGMWWSDPQAGLGNLSDLFPVDANVLCYEISELHCKVLESKGYARNGSKSVRCLDFLKLASEYRGGGFHRIVMNPPYSSGRWQAHTEAAAKVLRKGGVLVAILPASAKNKFDLPGCSLEWSQTYDNEFAGTGISVIILRAIKNV